MAYIAALNGYAAPRVDREFTYCELGCGQGLTSIGLAAMHPQAKFYASDFNPAHIQNARELAEAGQVKNLALFDRSFAELLKEELPAFDYISLHGVYSWVPESVRGEIRELIRKKLKPGGLVMLSYNAMPGWAYLQPIRRMMQAYGQSLPGDSIERARQAFAFVRHLADKKAAYFTMNPGAAEHLKSLGDADQRYVAHEYMTPHGDPFYFSDVCTAMQGIGLAYAGGMVAEENYVELVPNPDLIPFLQSVPTRTVLETHRDFVTNARFRNDLYAAQPEVPRAPQLTLDRLDGLAFALAALPENLPLKGTRRKVNFDLSGVDAPAVRAIHERLQSGPATAREIQKAASIPAETAALTLLQQLVLAGHLLVAPASASNRGWSALSTAVIERGIRLNRPHVPLPAGRSATMLQFELAYAAMIEAKNRYEDPRAAAKGVFTRLKGSGVGLIRKLADGTVEPMGDGDTARELESMWKRAHDPASAEARFLRLHGVV